MVEWWNGGWQRRRKGKWEVEKNLALEKMSQVVLPRLRS